MNVPVFRETVTFADFSSIAVAVCSIVPFYKSCVNHLTDRRGFYRRHLSHLVGLHPGSQITKKKTPELFEAARKSLIRRRFRTNGKTAQQEASWHEIDLDWKGGRLVNAEILSRNGGKLNIRYGDETKTYDTKKGRRITFKL